MHQILLTSNDYKKYIFLIPKRVNNITIRKVNHKNVNRALTSNHHFINWGEGIDIKWNQISIITNWRWVDAINCEEDRGQLKFNEINRGVIEQPKNRYLNAQLKFRGSSSGLIRRGDIKY